MILSLTSALLFSTSASSPITANHFLTAANACVSAVKANGVDEQVLINGGWIPVTTEAEEAATSIRTYGRREAVPIYLRLEDRLAKGCVAQADSLPEGGLAPLLATFDAAFGKPTLSVGDFRQWKQPHHSILFGGAGGKNVRVGVAVTYLPGASE